MTEPTRQPAWGAPRGARVMHCLMCRWHASGEATENAIHHVMANPGHRVDVEIIVTSTVWSVPAASGAPDER